MTLAPHPAATIIRTERGLTISGTRITLYDVMDYLQAQYPPKFIGDALALTEEQLLAALAYVEAHNSEMELEYQQILNDAAETRRYWEEKNREQLERIAAAPPRPGYEAVRAKLQQRKARREAQKQ
ncbi:MAG: DUF433 domain-containing protein [Cyanobacteria bacterium RI_101]|nr:DUF433 domain-containing protein [Cyanobacteria bacterium RI_101]